MNKFLTFYSSNILHSLFICLYMVYDIHISPLNKIILSTGNLKAYKVP